MSLGADTTGAVPPMRPFRHVLLSTLLALAFVVLASPLEAQDAPPDAATQAEQEATPPEGTGETPSVDPALAVPEPAAPTLNVIVIDAATYGIDPIVGRVATDTLRRTAGTIGYGVIDPEATIAAARSIRMAY